MVYIVVLISKYEDDYSAENDDNDSNKNETNDYYNGCK
jgi:hypothetical protein